MMKQKDELLKARYKVIALWPTSLFKVGDILYKYIYTTSNTGMYCYVTRPESPLFSLSLSSENVEDHPHLFKKLEWWECRNPEDMPEYVTDGQCVVSASWNESIATIDGTEWLISNDIMRLFQPATKEEYEVYTGQK